MKKLFYLLLFFTLPAAGQFISLQEFSSRAASMLFPLYYPEIYYEIQIAELNRSASLNFEYDDKVGEYIKLFLDDRKEDLLIFIERSEKYFPIIEPILAEQNLPDELKYLAVLESGLSPMAVSVSEATGLWQFKVPSGREMGLTINDYIDERCDPELSTIAACRYLNYLYNRFNSWELSLLAYNAGPNYLDRCIKSLDSRDLHVLNPNLTPAAQKYLPALTALVYLFNNYQNHFGSF